MAEKLFKTRIQVRRDTTANWLLNKDVIPAEGEPCLDLDTGLVKYGNGTDTYENLPVAGGMAATHYEGIKQDGETDDAVIERVLTGLSVTANKDDIFIVKTLIAGTKYSYTAYVYNGKLSVKEIAMDKITGLPAALEQKVSVQAGYRMITDAEGEKLEKLVLSEDGTVEVSGTIAAGNVDGLESWITTRAATLKGLSENNLTDALKTKIESSQANVIEIVKVNGVAVEVSAEDKSVNIPMATAAALGVVKGTDAENGIAVADDGTMSVNSVNVNKLVQTEGDSIVLDGGNSAE